jgi:putative membrane protein
VLREGIEPDPRFTLANERTFLAWIRTSLGLIAAAVGFETFAGDIVAPVLRTVLASVLLLFAVVLAVVAVVRWVGVERAMRSEQPLPFPWIAYLLAALLSIAGIVLAIAIVV